MSHSPQATAGFDRFDFDPSLTRAVSAAGFVDPTPIQAQAIPAAMQKQDVLGLAQTGTGKTAAFALPLLHRLLHSQKQGTRALIVAPTRELATQINAEIRNLAKFTDLKTITVYGGVSAHSQIQALRRRPDIVVACPGRLLDLFRQGHVFLKGIEVLVLDEADQMFDMGFLPDIRRIIAELPATRQNLLFSATMPKDIRKLAAEILNDPVEVEIDAKGPARTVRHAIYPVADQGKNSLLQRLLAHDDVETAIVFTRTKHRAKRIAQQLDKQGIRATSLQGNMSQAQRDRAMRGFRQRKFDVLVATDIAARGIDVADISHVINYDVPATAEAYTHRIGRTGRATKDGEAFTIMTGADRRIVRDIERTLGRKIERRQIDGFTVDLDAGGRPPSPNKNKRKQTRSAGAGNGGRSNNRRRPQSRKKSRPQNA